MVIISAALLNRFSIFLGTNEISINPSFVSEIFINTELFSVDFTFYNYIFLTLSFSIVLGITFYMRGFQNFISQQAKNFRGFPNGFRSKSNCYFLAHLHGSTYVQKGKKNYQYPTFKYQTHNNNNYHYYYDKQAQRYIATFVGLPAGAAITTLTIAAMIDYFNFSQGNQSVIREYLGKQQNPHYNSSR